MSVFIALDQVQKRQHLLPINFVVRIFAAESNTARWP
jgi:hypothetical protein